VDKCKPLNLGSGLGSPPGSAVQVDPRLTPCQKRAWFHRFKLEHDEPLSSFAFNFNLRLYIPVVPRLPRRRCCSFPR